MQGYSKDARDSTRISDLGVMRSALELTYLDTSKYPLPTDNFTVTYSGSKVWYQGTFGESVLTNVSKVDKVPKDPLTDKPYTYSVTNTKQEYQLAGLMEGELAASNTIMTQANAWDTVISAIVTGNYNSTVHKSLSGTTCVVLSLPSIVSNQPSTTTDLWDILASTWLVYNGHYNLPSDYRESKYNADGGFDFTSNQLVVYTDNDSCNPLYSADDDTARTTMITNLQTAYSGTILDWKDNVGIFTDFDLTDTSSLSIQWKATVNNYLGWNLTLKATGWNSGGSFTQTPPYLLTFWSAGEYIYTNAIAIDDQWNSYITWKYNGTISIDGINLTAWNWGQPTAFYAKIDNDGNAVWAKSIVSTAWQDWWNDIYYRDGAVYVVWEIQWSNDFWSFTLSASSADAYITKIDAEDGTFLRATKFGWSYNQDAYALVVDTSWNSYVVWDYDRFSDFMSNDDLPWEFGDEVYVTKFSSTGSMLWANGFTSYSYDDAKDIALKSNGNVVMLSRHGDAADGLVSFWAYTLDVDDGNGFYTEIDPSGTVVNAFNHGTWALWPYHIYLDSSDNIVTAAQIQWAAYFGGTDVSSPGSAPNNRIMLAKTNSTGTVQWAYNYWNSWEIQPRWLYIDGNNDIYVTWFYNWDSWGADFTWFPLGWTQYEHYVAKFTSNGWLTWAVNYWTPGHDSWYDVAVNEFWDIYTVWGYRGSGTYGPFNLTLVWWEDAVVMKLTASWALAE